MNDLIPSGELDIQKLMNFVVVHYRDVITCQVARGAFTDKILLFTKYEETPEVANLSTDQVNTLIGIKLLEEKFPEHKAKWKFICQKARKNVG